MKKRYTVQHGRTSRTYEATGPLAAVQKFITARNVREGGVLHVIRGSQSIRAYVNRKGVAHPKGVAE